MLQIFSNFMKIKSNTIIISVLNLKEIKSHEDGFHEF